MSRPVAIRSSEKVSGVILGSRLATECDSCENTEIGALHATAVATIKPNRLEERTAIISAPIQVGKFLAHLRHLVRSDLTLVIIAKIAPQEIRNGRDLVVVQPVGK